MINTILKYVGICFFWAIMPFVKIHAQQESLYTQYMFNGIVINPAYAGSNESLNLTVSARKQWLGMDGAPSTQTLSLHAPLKKEKIALGLVLINDKIGVTRQTGINLIYAYRIYINKTAKLAFGLQGGATQYSSNYSHLSSRDQSDPFFTTDVMSGIIPSFGTGIYYNAAKLYAGISIPHLVNNIFNDTSVTAGVFQRRHILFTTGYVFTITPAWKVKPSVLFRIANGLPAQIDLNANLLFKEVLWIGGSYRTNNSMNALAQVQLTNQLKIGYSFDLSFSQISSANFGSHEVMINYNFTFLKSKVITPRYF